MVMDTGKKRGLDTVLDIMSYPYAAPLANVIPDIYAYFADQKATGLSHDMFIAFLEEHEEIVQSVTFYQERKSHPTARLLGYPKALTVAHYLLSQIDSQKGREFHRDASL